MTKLCKQIFVLLLGVLVTAGAALGSTSAESCGTAADRAAVVQAVQTMFAAAAKDNIALFHSVASPTFMPSITGSSFTATN